MPFGRKLENSATNISHSLPLYGIIQEVAKLFFLFVFCYRIHCFRTLFHIFLSIKTHSRWKPARERNKKNKKLPFVRVSYFDCFERAWTMGIAMLLLSMASHENTNKTMNFMNKYIILFVALLYGILILNPPFVYILFALLEQTQISNEHSRFKIADGSV